MIITLRNGNEYDGKKIFEQQEDGTLKLIEQPSLLVKRLLVYRSFRESGLFLDEI